MAINYANKYSKTVDEIFSVSNKTDIAVNQDYEFIGVKTVNVYSIGNATMNDYNPSGVSRYGTPEELQDSTQELTLEQKRSFTYTIDRTNYIDTEMTKIAGVSLQRQISNVVVPEIDMYRISKMVASAGTVGTATTPSKANAYSLFLDGCEALSENKTPETGRIAYVSNGFYKLLKQDPSFVKSGDMSQDMLAKGVLGEVDGVRIITLPSSYLPEKTFMLITHPVATTSPIKLADYKIHENPQGINGWLVEGLVYFDAFVLKNKAKAIYTIASA